MKKFFSKSWHFIAIAVFFVIVATVYMAPELRGQKIGAPDNLEAVFAMGETFYYNGETGRPNWWNGAVFSGMPNYQIGGSDFEATKWLSPFMNVLRSGYGSPIRLLLLYLACFYALLYSMRIGKWLSVIGALAMALSSYFVIIVGVSHVTKATTIALMTLALAGFYLIFNKHRRTGVCLCMIGTMAGFSPHPQMTYYIAFLFAAFGIAELWKTYKNKSWKPFAINCILALASLGIGAGTSIANTFANMEFVKESVRGGMSDLDEGTTKNVPQTGLDFKYASENSYGISETLTLLIPNYKGGSSAYNLDLDEKELSRMCKDGVQYSQAQMFSGAAGTYWGKQPATDGPVYLGAVIIFLFVLGLLIVKGPYKWALLSVSVLSIILSWGDNFEFFNRFVFDYFPLYNKFRAFVSILIIAEIAVPILAMMAVKEVMEIVKNNTMPLKQLKKYIYISLGSTLAVCVLAYLGTEIFSSFLKDSESLVHENGMRNINSIELKYYREALLSADVLRTIIYLLLTATLLLTFIYGKLKQVWMFALLGALVMFDLWTVDKRYVNDSNFKTQKDYSAEYSVKPWEQALMDYDKSPSYRIANSYDKNNGGNRTAYRFKSITGYSAVKLRRYNDILNEHLTKGHMPVVNMLNAKYIIQSDANGNAEIAQNSGALGNAWFVDKLVKGETPREECDALMKLDLKKEAVVGKDFISKVKNMNPGADSLASVVMTKYEPDNLFYDVKCSKPGTIVFSEIYYPYGWNAYVDDKPVEHYRVNYVLRALNIESGNHKVRFEFRPESVEKGNTISMFFVVLMYLILAACIVWGIIEKVRLAKN